MSGDVTIDGERLAGDGAIELPGRARMHRLGCGDAFVIAPGGATRDGRPLLGHATRVEWGRETVLRIGGRRLMLAWRANGGRRRATPTETCRLCFGIFGAREDLRACRCDAPFHAECFALRIDCPACGAPGEGTPS